MKLSWVAAGAGEYLATHGNDETRLLGRVIPIKCISSLWLRNCGQDFFIIALSTLSSPERNVKGCRRVSSQLLYKLVFRMKKIKLIPEPLPSPGPSRLPTAINCQILPIWK